MRETRNLQRLRAAFPLAHKLLDSISVTNGFNHRQVAEYKREIRLELFKVLASPDYSRRVANQDHHKLAGLFLFKYTVKGGDYWWEVNNTIYGKLWVPR